MSACSVIINCMKMQPYQTVDEYLENFSGETREKLDAIRKLIKQLEPEAKEKISYGIPTTTLNDKYLVYFAGYDSHISIYPIPRIVPNELQEKIDKYQAGKGT